MPPATRSSKDETFNFRIDAELKAAFTQATETEHRPAAQVLRDFMRAYVERKKREAFAAEARRQSRSVAQRSQDPSIDDFLSLKQLETLADEDHFKDEWIL